MSWTTSILQLLPTTSRKWDGHLETCNCCGKFISLTFKCIADNFLHGPIRAFCRTNVFWVMKYITIICISYHYTGLSTLQYWEGVSGLDTLSPSLWRRIQNLPYHEPLSRQNTIQNLPHQCMYVEVQKCAQMCLLKVPLHFFVFAF